ncbi:hypothetical protein LQM11_004463 [Vibrio parahaemolyticus]|nr:hypothetical protein [Vibrio parahaemolyticus]
MKAPKVLFAYCKELGRSLSISEARAEYFAIDQEKRKRFSFSCSDQNCGVLISGVNYHVKAEDGVKFREAHYRSPHPHNPACEWVQFTDDVGQNESVLKSGNDHKGGKARLKLSDYINSFDPLIESSDSKESSDTKQSTSVNLSNDSSRNVGSSANRRWNRYTRTNQLQRLIDSWQETKKKLSFDEQMALTLNIVNLGEVYQHRYITHINKGIPNEYHGVIYGGGRLVKRYGRGFLFQFFDKCDNKPISIYVNKDVMNKGKFGHYVDEILSMDNVRYFQLFLLNPTRTERVNNKKQTVVELEITHLRQLAIYYELNSNTLDESSIGNDGCKPI